jgi:hypothetical protein
MNTKTMNKKTMNKKTYTSPTANVENIETVEVLASSFGIGTSDDTINSSDALSNGHRGGWGFVW